MYSIFVYMDKIDYYVLSIKMISAQELCAYRRYCVCTIVCYSLINSLQPKSFYYSHGTTIDSLHQKEAQQMETLLNYACSVVSHCKNKESATAARYT